MNQDKIVSAMLGEDSVLTPSDVCNKHFSRVVFGGYHNGQVESFLARVANVLESVQRQITELKAQREQYKKRIEDYQQMEETLHSALAASQKFGENVVESARREAEGIVASGQAERERVLAQAARLPAALANEIAQLQQHRNRLRKDVQAILATHKTLLESLDSAEESLGMTTSGGAIYFAKDDGHPAGADADRLPEDNAAFTPISEDLSGGKREGIA